MPVDEAGNRADIVMDANSTISRMNLGRLYEHYINAASRDVSKQIVGMVNHQPNGKHLLTFITELFDSNRSQFDLIYKYLMGYYSIVSPKQFNFFNSEVDDEGKIKHLYSVVKNGIYLYLPTDNTPESEEIINQLQKHYRPTYGPVSYIGSSGRRVTTKSPVRISSIYMMLLEKTGDDWAAVASGKLQHFGILSQVTKSDKYSQATRPQAVRAIGETEGRIFVSYAGRRLTAEIMDRNNNPRTHKNIVWSILTNPVPTNIDYAVDRAKINFGGAKPLQLVSHVLLCSGVKFVYKPDTP